MLGCSVLSDPNPSPRVLWQKVLWDRLKSLFQSTLGGRYEPLPEYSGRALQSEDYHLKHSPARSPSSGLVTGTPTTSWSPRIGKSYTEIFAAYSTTIRRSSESTGIARRLYPRHFLRNQNKLKFSRRPVVKPTCPPVS